MKEDLQKSNLSDSQKKILLAVLEAFKYYFKHFKELTLFLRIPGVPLDNTIVERLLKTPILNRKNSYFYKTQFSAFVGDMLMRLIETCKAAKVNPQRYLLAIHNGLLAIKKY